ncbi:hypothetical protein IAG44_42210 [Streptomyces roseirectus]|uniref:Uncharacterized protein n=1 Tax=Streptomyces roseirectus TaxID=2768066 RepID=A0A7H0IRF6_9ACTN|nr:hypothetical protein [Streptomyces roseirectus]QNP75372.1 hypothetical protein IAG44_42210 [Streptomyces roseirectus]
MFSRKGRPVQNKVVARRMQEFFGTLPDAHRADPQTVARRYASALWRAENPLTVRRPGLVDGKRLSRSRFYVGLSVGGGADLESVTKRVALVSDTLLLSHESSHRFHEIGRHGASSLSRSARVPVHNLSYHLWYGIHCPDLDALGKWVLDAEPLLRAGLAWYLPRFTTVDYDGADGPPADSLTRNGVRWWSLRDSERHDQVIDYLVRDGRAVDASGAEPLKSQFVRPVLRIDLPFLDGCSLRDFSEITVHEFDAYARFRDFLRQRFLDLDAALDDTQSDRELTKLGLEIKDQIWSARTEMETLRRKRAVSVTGAAVGSVGAVLVAVYGPALQAAIAALGAGGGLWGLVHAATENSSRPLRQDKWFYVWALQRAGGR